MPRYDYRCGECGAVYEKREGFDAPSVQVCPTCSGTARRVLTPPAIVFKGSGWYVTDSRKGSPDGDKSAGSSSSSGTTSTKTESSSTSTSDTPASSSGDSGAKADKSSS